MWLTKFVANIITILEGAVYHAALFAPNIMQTNGENKVSIKLLALNWFPGFHKIKDRGPL